MKIEKKIHGDKCNSCFYFHNPPNIQYNKIHDNVKLCKYGNVTTKKTSVCVFYKKNKRRKIKININKVRIK